MRKVDIIFMHDDIEMDFIKAGFKFMSEKTYLNKNIPYDFINRHEQVAYRDGKKYILTWDIISNSKEELKAVLVDIQTFVFDNGQWKVYYESKLTIKELLQRRAKEKERL
ncbi:hypothetical protein [Thermoanaerobacterium thermosaccharolyticum]|uniref:hypothetical protein n=1 Tax=Thermoanaerobacterium thermosaccharolyticum TaxID=1517 RepID=UPI002FD9259B